jgi:ferredoxin-NADP reductase
MGGMPAYQLKLKDRKPVADATTAFFFDKPPEFTFRPGQFIELTALNPVETDAEGNTRAFSIASAPSENYLMVATRMRDTAFKRVAKACPIGTEFQVGGPFGNLVLHRNAARVAVLLAGGIGITPFRSMVVEAAKEKLPHRLFLFFSNRRPSEAAFLDELRSLGKANPNYTFVASVTSKEPTATGWQGETGHVTAAMVGKHVVNLKGPLYYIAGPAGFVTAMQKMLADAGIDVDDIRAEEFAGY